MLSLVCRRNMIPSHDNLLPPRCCFNLLSDAVCARLHKPPTGYSKQRRPCELAICNVAEDIQYHFAPLACFGRLCDRSRWAALLRRQILEVRLTEQS